MDRLQKLQLLAVLMMVQKFAESEGQEAKLFSNIQLMQIGLEIAKLEEKGDLKELDQTLLDTTQQLYKDVF
ncbi:hypothetical protein LAV73_06620 [Lysinibacillus xylanilyticus]|uniref:hypothetical protein n=1 Tax=Lysinibacillus xylanilyticus TaxID=582475 RepID=UPI002B248D6B|nr:hypothetical protein [Lysinibacillus xylanilyticus]MEB2279674.1 hypothetical protein [Lysinibacillus xylanilyticus]